ncbi:hypothetical protein V6N13_033626 [Hibiscus sabdariffa]
MIPHVLALVSLERLAYPKPLADQNVAKKESNMIDDRDLGTTVIMEAYSSVVVGCEGNKYGGRWRWQTCTENCN